MTKRDADRLYFVSFCIEQYKNQKQMSGHEVMELFDQYHIIDYLYNHYDILHTQGAQWLVEEIDEMIKDGQGKVMIPTITNKNLYLLLPGKVTGFIGEYEREHTTNGLEVLRMFYHSNTYSKLEKEETKLWHYGPVALYEEFKDIK